MTCNTGVSDAESSDHRRDGRELPCSTDSAVLRRVEIQHSSLDAESADTTELFKEDGSEDDTVWEAELGYTLLKAADYKTGPRSAPGAAQALRNLLETYGGWATDGQDSEKNRAARDFVQFLHLFLETGQSYRIIPTCRDDADAASYAQFFETLAARGPTVAKGFVLLTPELVQYAEEYGVLVCCSSSLAVSTY
jgi:hypothetical protein